MKSLNLQFLRTQSSYNIYIVEGNKTSLLADYCRKLGNKIAIITDDNVKALYGNALYTHLQSCNLNVHLFSFPGGEFNKTRQTKERLEDEMLQQGMGRDTCIVALGGGIVTDMAGYVAATYCRGIPLILHPTSLLAMVDASIGGKTGVNTSYGKNLIGSVYQPKAIMIDLNILKTLSSSELTNGFVEMIKHGLIADSKYLEFLETNVEKILALEHGYLEPAILTSCRIKKEIVEQDEHEIGLRRVLNFGHTVGHAIERCSNYKVPHGQAVAQGILVESYLAKEMNFLSTNDFTRICVLFNSFKIPKLTDVISAESLLDAMLLDKKSLNKTPRFVMLSSIGSTMDFNEQYCTPVDSDLLKQALETILEGPLGNKNVSR